MTLHIKLTHLVVGIVVGALLAGGGYALATTNSSVIRACVNTRTRALTVPASGRCGTGSTALTWNKQGLRGAAGARGAAGTAGASGTAATLSVGSVSTGSPGSQASVTNSGTSSNAILNFSIPQGATGQAAAASSEPTAYGQIWMGSETAELAQGDAATLNVGTVGGGDGSAIVDIEGCSSAGLSDPVINVTADDDSHDDLLGHHSTVDVADAYVSSWAPEPAPNADILAVSVVTTSPMTGDVVNSDFSISVIC